MDTYKYYTSVQFCFVIVHHTVMVRLRCISSSVDRQPESTANNVHPRDTTHPREMVNDVGQIYVSVSSHCDNDSP